MKCGTVYDVSDRTIYLKCKVCGEDVYREKGEESRGPMFVVDYGRTTDSKWVKVYDPETKEYFTYWKEG